ncbi:MAG TPA: hypothetical protein VEX60_16390 [Pyrinomonadaceae bacterium]|nr:hypothetical protein [Pyrinomonadaceae bacterium]
MRFALLLAAISFRTVAAQEPRVEVGRRATAIPKVCESVAPASIEGEVDMPALVKEAQCKGAGDMLSDYTYVMSYTRRERKDKGRIEEETLTYEVYMPTLKGGTHGRGVLLVTSRDGVPVPPAELEKERLRAGERLEKEEEKNARVPVSAAAPASERVTGMLPLGMYGRTGINRATFGFKRGGAALDIHTFLRTCELKLVRRERRDGREAMVFTFNARPDAQLGASEQYVAQLSGMIWIDADDRIVTRLVGWPSAVAVATKKSTAKVKEKVPAAPALPPGEGPPAVLVEMARLPEGVWLPREIRLNGSDYPTLFDRITYSVNFTYGEYKRFNTETKDVRLNPPKPR